MARYTGPRYRPPTRRLDPKNPHDKLLLDAEGPIKGFQETYVAEFDAKADAIKADEELSPIGKQRRLAKLVAEYESHPHVRDICDAWIASAEKEAQRLTDLISQRPSREGLSVAEQVREEHRHHRAMLDFRQLNPEQRHKAVWAAIDKASTSEQAREFLYGVMDDGLLDDQTESRARQALRVGGNPEAVRALSELVGDPTSPGALTIAKYSRDALPPAPARIRRNRSNPRSIGRAAWCACAAHR